MSKEKTETRGRKALYENEKTVHIGARVSETIYEKLLAAGDESGKGYGHHVRLACEALFKTRRKKSATKNRKRA